MRSRQLDVRALAPPEPLTAVLAALHDLAAGEQLVVLHRREPYPLYALLPDLGFTHRVEPQGTDVRITIERAPRAGSRT